MPDSLAVRKMQPGDLDQIAVIEEASFPAPWSLVMLAAALGLANSLNFVLEINKRIVAFVFARLVSEELHIINLAVFPQIRRQGLGRRLLRFVLGKAHEEGVEWAYLEVRTSNLAAIRLYQREGFRIIHRLPRYYEDGSDAYEMGLVIEKGETR